MIFVTVGTQLPFDRLVKTVDAWSASAEAADAFAQIGDGLYQPAHMPWLRYLLPEAFRTKLDAATLVVSHAGMGNVLLALRAQKPMIVMPRRAAFREHRNDHQLATATWLRQVQGITVVEDAAELAEALRCVNWTKPNPVRAEASPELLSAIREFINRR